MNTKHARREFIAVLIVTIAAGVVRLSYPWRLGLDHFDEGIYALGGLWALNPKGLSSLDSGLIPYAPPGLPILIGISYAIFGVSDVAAILVSIVAGILTIAAIGWVGYRTFGAGAGAAAAALAAFNGAHLLYSRMALTEASFMLAWVMGLGVGGRFLEKPTPGRGLMLGIMVGLGMNLKYSGWMVGVLVAVTAFLGVLLESKNRTRSALLRTFGFGAMAAFIALVIYFPWYRFVERNGGYAGLIKHHRSYVGGPETWLPHLKQQLAQVTALSGGEYWLLTAISLAIAMILVLVRGFPIPDKTARVWLITLFGYCAIAFTLLPTVEWWMPLFVLPWLARLNPSARLLGVGWVVMSIVTPFYHPYSRLWMPLHIFGFLIIAGILKLTIGVIGWRIEEGTSTFKNPRVRLLAGLISVVGVAYSVDQIGQLHPAPIPSPTGLYPISWTKSELAAARNLFTTQAPTSIRAYARPSILFYVLTQVPAGVSRTQSAKDAMSGNRPGDYTLLDEGIFNSADFEQVPLARSVGWEEPLSPVTWLDIDPIAAYGMSYRRKVQVVFAPSATLRTMLGATGSPIAPRPLPPTSPSNR